MPTTSLLSGEGEDLSIHRVNLVSKSKSSDLDIASEGLFEGPSSKEYRDAKEFKDSLNLFDE